MVALHADEIAEIEIKKYSAQGKWVEIQGTNRLVTSFEITELFKPAEASFLADFCELLDDENVREIDLRELIADANNPKGAVKVERVR